MRFHLKYILEVGGGPELCTAPVRRLFGAERTPLVPQIRTAPLFEPLLQGEHKIMRSRTKKDLQFRTAPLLDSLLQHPHRVAHSAKSDPEIPHSALI